MISIHCTILVKVLICFKDCNLSCLRSSHWCCAAEDCHPHSCSCSTAYCCTIISWCCPMLSAGFASKENPLMEDWSLKMLVFHIWSYSDFADAYKPISPPTSKQKIISFNDTGWGTPETCYQESGMASECINHYAKIHRLAFWFVLFDWCELFMGHFGFWWIKACLCLGTSLTWTNVLLCWCSGIGCCTTSLTYSNLSLLSQNIC